MRRESKLLVTLALVCCFMAVSGVPAEGRVCCDPCQACCAPPPVETVICLYDPCTCCTYKVCVCVPACCGDEAPCIDWRDGIFKKRVATLCWPSCGHEASVVITGRGKVKVRG